MSEQEKPAAVEGARDVMQGRVSQYAADGIKRCQCFHRVGFGEEVLACWSPQQLLLRAVPEVAK